MPRFKLCRITGCDRPVRYCDLCNTHYMRVYHGFRNLYQGKISKKELFSPINSKKPYVVRTCHIRDCGQLAVGFDLCKMHYERVRRHSLGLISDSPLPFEDLILPKGVRPTSRITTCTYGTCTRPKRTAGLCSIHYERNRRGEPMDNPRMDRRGPLRLGKPPGKPPEIP